MKMYTLRDSKVETYLPPFLAENNITAKRLLIDSANQDNIIFKHPEDFQLFQIGEFNKDNGEIKPIPHVSIGLVIDIIPKNEEN